MKKYLLILGLLLAPVIASAEDKIIYVYSYRQDETNGKIDRATREYLVSGWTVKLISIDGNGSSTSILIVLTK